MLINSSHKRWFLGTLLATALALGLYFYFDWQIPGGLTGGTTVGLWFGIAGTALMIYAGLLSALRKVPTWWWLGPRSFWLRGHIWLGLFSVVLILCHSGFSLGGPLEVALWIVLGLVILTGIYGLALQQFLPRALTVRIPNEAPYEQIPHMCRVMQRKAESVLHTVWEQVDKLPAASIQLSQNLIGAKGQLQEFYEREIQPFLQEEYRRSAMLANATKSETAFSRLRSLPGLADVKDRVTSLEELCDERRLLGEQERLWHWLHAWLLLH
ncbi:MAG: hypothetical protein AB7K24_28715, partial [Gemmataceae bacterium]